MKTAGNIQIGPDNGFRGQGPLGLEGKDADAAIGVFTTLISSAIGIITIIAGIWFVFSLLAGAIALMGAGGDKAQIESAKKKLTNGAIGLFVVIAGIFLVDLFGSIIGFNILDVALSIPKIRP